MITCILFDLDGTLLIPDHKTSKKAHLYSYLAFSLIRRWGISPSVRYLANVTSIIREPSARFTIHERLTHSLSHCARISQQKADGFIRQTMNKALTKIDRSFKPTPGALETLHWARNNFRLVLATNPLWPKRCLNK